MEKNLYLNFATTDIDIDEDKVDFPHWRRIHPYMKIGFPTYVGGDPGGWILKAEKYFHYYQTPEKSKVDVASMYLAGDALDIFSWLD